MLESQAASPTNPFQQIFTLFQTASTKLRYPKISFIATSGEKVQLYLATKGYIAIKLDGEYSGKITQFPEFRFVMYYTAQTLKDEIQKFATDPIKESAITGRKYGHCCFCGRTLDNASSVYHGYGPICADNFGLPWGESPESPESPIQAIIGSL